MTTNWSAWAASELGAIRATGQWRSTRSFDARGPVGRLGDRDVVSFASNDYLGLSTHPDVVAAAHEAIERWGAGATASRLVVGSRPVHDELECELAQWKGADRAVVFPTGYAANVGVLTTLGGSDAVIFSDELNHASIIDGSRLSRSTVHVFRHRDLDHLAELLTQEAGSPRRRIVVSDAVFSMDGDVAAVDELDELCAAHGALLVLDEAHTVLGPHLSAGRGGATTVHVGTLSKTLGALGGFAAAPAAIADLLVNRARSYIFTTALSPADSAAALAALRVLRGAAGASLVDRLAEVVDRVAPGHPSPIVPIVLGEEDTAIAAAHALLERGLLVPAIRPPTVAPGTSRLRLAFSAAHSDAMIDDLVLALDELGLR